MLVQHGLNCTPITHPTNKRRPQISQLFVLILKLQSSTWKYSPCPEAKITTLLLAYQVVAYDKFRIATSKMIRSCH